jgi:hypothetical protein
LWSASHLLERNTNVKECLINWLDWRVFFAINMLM